jgi:hypothetical protein
MEAEKEYILFCDESDRRGPFFSNFYGGVRVGAKNLNQINGALLAKRKALGLTSEVKWEKTDLKIVDRYEKMLRTFFTEVAAGRVVVRIMFTQNVHVPVGLTPAQQAESYYILYYQFLKHAFGLRYLPQHAYPPRLRIYFDEMADTREKVAKFRGYVGGLVGEQSIRSTGLVLEQQDITEVRSHDHILMQCLDVVLGSMSFRLNNRHLALRPDTGMRGKRTLAKERLYKFILGEIKRVTGKRSFNIGITTGLSAHPGGQWSDPYLHWRFVPRQHAYDASREKP